MAKHDIKANYVDLISLGNKEFGEVVANNLIEYSEAFNPTGLQLVYADWVINLINEIEVGGGEAGSGTNLSEEGNINFGGHAYLDTEIFEFQNPDFALSGVGEIVSVAKKSGKYYLACKVGSVFTIVRLNSNFELEFTYGTFNAIVNSVDVNDDETLLAVGKFTTYTNLLGTVYGRNRIVKLNPDGTDVLSLFTSGTGFNAGSGAFTNVQNAKVKILPDSTILVMGQFTSYNGTNRRGIIRLNQDGSLYSTWNSGVGIDGGSQIVWDAELQSDGKIVVVGYFTTYNGTALPQVGNFSGLKNAFRINSDGSLDTGFAPSNGGSTAVDYKTVAIRSNGKIILAGTGGMLLQVNADGTSDTAFNTGLRINSNIITSSSGQILNLEILTDESILISSATAMVFRDGGGSIFLLKLDSSGNVDENFNSQFNGGVLKTFTEFGTVTAFTGKSANPSIPSSFFNKYGNVDINTLVQISEETAEIIANKIGFDFNRETGTIDYKGDYEANFVARSLVTKQYVDTLVSGLDPYGDYLTFEPLTPLWSIGFADDFLQFFDGAYTIAIGGLPALELSGTEFNFVIGTGGMSFTNLGFILEEGDGKFIYDGVSDNFIWQLGATGEQVQLSWDSVNDRMNYLSSAPVLAYNFDKPILINGNEVAELIDFPINNPIQLDEIGGEATIIQLGLNPTGSVVNFQTPENEFGSLAEPLTDLTISLVLARRNKVTAYVQKITIPTRIDPLTNDDILWIGDAFNTGSDFVNRLEMKFQMAPAPQNRIIEITNTAIDLTGFGVDTDLKIYLQFDEEIGNEENFIDSSGYGNNFIAVSGMSTGALPLAVTDPANTPLRATRGGRQGVLWNHVTSGNNGAFVGAYAPFFENLVAFTGFTVMFEFEGTSALVNNTAGLASFCNKTGFGFRIQKSGVDGGTHDNKFEFRINANTSSAQRIRSASAYTSDTRIHLAFTYENGIGLSLYINGVLNSSSTDTLGTTQIDETINPAFYLGTRQENLTLTASGPKNGTFMNEFKYLTRRLLLSEIEAEATRLGYL